ncbi:integral peroxisomal membrane peroxin-domain-containing protein [Echria macrotheca]|uniref:Integral peroxisomal membrane peroxin-domain-containing protein n=1 Tax=Echria macrotheca TaxID=438768 RepID=A0AAJ0F4R4_9PEZI|nr:integral peroxisomal membrane peroxin-domain-containing protein [Echria macrotheca]
MTDFASDFAAAFLNAPDAPDAPDPHDDPVPVITANYHDEDTRSETSGGAAAAGDPAKKARSLRRGLVKAANIQDMLLEKLLHQMLPLDDIPPAESSGGGAQVQIQTPDGGTTTTTASPDDPLELRPGFTVGTMSNNFRRFNARIGVVFQFQARVLRLLSWRRPSHTLSLLAVYTFVCLDPYLLCVLPLVIGLFGVLVPSFIARHPAPPPLVAVEPDRSYYSYYAARGGPPLAPARTVRPVKELSRDFFRNMGDLQNCMEDFSVAHDKVVALVVPVTNFSDEALSSAVFVLLAAAAAVMSIAAHLLPWRFVALAGGWAAIWSTHPAVARVVAAQQQQQTEGGGKQTTYGNVVRTVHTAFDNWVKGDMLLDEAPETREVEIFELQRLVSDGGAGEWEPWLFSPSPYDPLSAGRIAGHRPRGTRFFEDVLPPAGWEWSEKKWALDLWSREWVEERIITGVEVETEGERWVYDMFVANNGGQGEGGDMVVDQAAREREREMEGNRNQQQPTVSWEEGEEGMGRRGEWRRRRWVRMVKRRNVN